MSLPEQLIRTRRFTAGVPVQFTVALGGSVVLFRRSSAGDDPVTGLWALDLDSGTQRLLADAVGSYATDANGELAVFVRDGRLWTVDVARGGLRCLPTEGPAAAARPDPTGRRIAYLSGDALCVIYADGTGDRTIAASAPYAWAPDGNRLLIARGALGTGWDRHGPYVVVQSRDQRTVRMLDSTGGVLWEQHDDHWVHIVPGLPARSRNGALIAHTDTGDTRHLTVDGVAVTPPGLQLRAVLSVDGDDVLFTASDEPTETHLWLHRIGAGIQRVSCEPGVHSGVRDKGVLVQVTHGPQHRVTVSRDGKPALEIASLAERPVLDLHATPLVLGPRRLRAMLFLPSWHRPGTRLPVLVDPYGGASRQRSTTEMDWRCVVSQWFAEHGFAVLVADGAGTPGRGPAWEHEIHGDMYGPVLDDQVAALQEAARVHPDLDLDRVGIRGWSFGGSLAVLAVLRRPDVFDVAVAGAAVTDQRHYDPPSRERFLGHPDEFPERYDACSLMREAPKLIRPLLLMHGLADDNVHPDHTLRLSKALHDAGRPHDVVLLPGVGHSAIGAPGTESLMSDQLHFLQRHLSA